MGRSGEKPFSDKDVRLSALRVLDNYKERTLDQLQYEVNRRRKRGTAEATPAQILRAVTTLVSRQHATFDGKHVCWKRPKS